MRSPTASTISGNTAMVALTPSSTAVVGDDDGIDPGIGGELCVFEGDNALEYELDLDRIAQALDHIPGQVGNDGAADAAEIDAGKIRFARQIVVEAVTASAVARVGAPQPDKSLPFRRRSHVEGHHDRRRSRGHCPLDQTFGAAMASSIDVVATVDRICRWLPAFAALATATSASG